VSLDSTERLASRRAEFSRWAPEAAACLLGLSCIGLYFGLREPSGAAPQLTLFFGRFHPLAVHLPIGILLLVAAAEGLTLAPRLRTRVDPTLPIVLPALMVAAVGSFGLGQLLAQGGGFPSKLVDTHRTLALFAVLGTAACFVAFRQHARSTSPLSRAGYRVCLAATVGVLSLGAHHGGSITRGEGYLTKYAPGPIRRWLGEEDKPPKDTDESAKRSEPLVWADVVMPILRDRCVECHGTEQTKGGLRLDSLEQLLKGGDGGPALVVGNGKSSPLVVRMKLPSEDVIECHRKVAKDRQATRSSSSVGGSIAARARASGCATRCRHPCRAQCSTRRSAAPRGRT